MGPKWILCKLHETIAEQSISEYLFITNYHSMEQSIFIGFLLSLLLGALIGIERELPRRGTKPGGANDFGGIRTYASIAFFGAIMTWLDITLKMNIWILFGSILS